MSNLDFQSDVEKAMSKILLTWSEAKENDNEPPPIRSTFCIKLLETCEICNDLFESREEESKVAAFNWRRPLMFQFVRRLCDWSITKTPPFNFNVMPGYENSLNHEVINNVLNMTPAVCALKEIWQTCNNNNNNNNNLGSTNIEMKQSTSNGPIQTDENNRNYDLQLFNQCKLLLGTLKERGILTVLGIACTVGSVDRVPPCLHSLLVAFNTPNRPEHSSILTVGARALAKHCHRTSDKYWGTAKGPELVRNNQANRFIYQFLQDIVWINIHLLPHEIEVFEVRVREGYGARWLCDGSKFRGFLEKYIEGGHH